MPINGDEELLNIARPLEEIHYILSEGEFTLWVTINLQTSPHIRFLVSIEDQEISDESSLIENIVEEHLNGNASK